MNNVILVGNGAVDNFDLTGESINTTIYAGGSADTVTASDMGASLTVLLGNGADTFNGGNGFSFINTGLGADTVNGGTGFERVSYSDSTVGVTVNLDTGVNTGGTAQGDILNNIEAVTGSNFDDILIGSTGNDIFTASGGNDIIIGGDGSDDFSGGGGMDTLTGGAGADFFQVFSYFNNDFADTITDFETGDVLRLFQGFDGTSSLLPAFIGTDAFSNIAGELRSEHSLSLIHI